MVTSLEILSNEVLMQVFEYFDAYHLFQAFFNLNSRFNQLLTDHRLHLKFHSKHVCYTNKIDINILNVIVNYLTAVTLINDKHIRIFMSITKDNNFENLQSLTLYQIRIKKSSIVEYLLKLKSLINLRIQSIGEMDALTRMILCESDLPNLKSFECTNPEYTTNILFTWPKQTAIEYLTVECILYGFPNLLLQTPKLKSLNIVLTSFGQEDATATSSPFPTMENLTDLTMKIQFVSYIQLYDIMQSMPNLTTLELSGASMGKNLDTGYQLKQLFGHLNEVILDDLKCLTSISSVDTVLKTFNEDFWSDVTCSIKYDRVYLSAFGHRK